MQFKFQCSCSGSLAFTGCASARYLLVSDNGHDTVHVIDVVHGRHMGFVVAAGTIPGPHGVAAMGSLVAVSAWKAYSSGKHFIQLFEGSAATWKPMRVISGGFSHPGSANGQLEMPCGLRFAICDDDMVVVVTDMWNNRVSMFRVCDGSFVRHVATNVHRPHDLEEWENGWLVASESAIGFFHGANERLTMTMKFHDLVGLTLVRDVGLLTREYSGAVAVFATFDAMKMAAMSADRVEWMAAVARAL